MSNLTMYLALVLAACFVLPLGAQSDSVTIDDQPTTEQNLARINDLRRASRYDDAADLLQELIDGARFKLVRVDTGLYIDAELWARRELSRDPMLQQAYRERYTASGERALEVAHADRGITPLREAYRRFGMTRPGLDAGLALAGRLLEAGDIPAADALCEELSWHPDQHEVRGQLLFLRGTCAALRGDVDRADSMAQRLAARDAQWAGRLTRLRASLAIPPDGGGDTVVDAGPVPEGLDVPLWDTPVDTAPVTNRPNFDGLRSIPEVFAEHVLVNTGRQVLALDRASGQPLWAYPREVGRGPGFEMNLPVWLDMRGVSVSGGRVFAVLGACRGVQGRGGAEVVPSNLLVCLDPGDGSVLWSRQSGEVAEGEPLFPAASRGGRSVLLQTHFVGTPVTAQGQVFTLVRKTSLTGIQTTWLASYDAADGRLRWFRHIALVQVRHGSDAARITPQLSVVGDTLYLTDQIAVAAALDIHSGAYHWLRVLAEDTSRRVNNLSLQTDGINTAPVLTSSGLVVQLSLDSQRRLFLLDPASGRMLREMDEDPRLADAQYLLDTGGGVVVVSRSYAVYWDGGVGEVGWVHTFPQDDQPRGRGAATQQFVVIPTNDGLTALRLSDGEPISRLSGRAGNVTVLGSEVLVATNGYVRSYMSWDAAYARLIDRIRSRPTDPGPGLSLAVLAMDRGESAETILEGIGLAIAALHRLPDGAAIDGRQAVFDRLRELAGPKREAAEPLRSRLFDLLAETASTADQLAAYHLDRGRYLVELGAPEQAVHHYQSVMVDPALAAASYAGTGDPASGPAGSTAQRELLTLVREHGQAVYHRYDALAKQELELLLAQPEPDADQLVSIANRYPLAVAASQALLIAAERLENAGQPIGALSQYQQALANAMTTTQRRVAAQALLRFYERERRSDEALALLNRLSKDHADLLPERQGVAMALEDWRSVFQAIHEDDTPYLAGALDRPVVLPGRLLLPPPGLGTDALHGGLYVFSGDDEIKKLDATRQGAAVWSAPVGGQQHFVLTDDQGQVLVWSVDTRTLIALDSQTGQPLWESPVDFSPLQEAAAARQDVDELPWVRVTPSLVCFVGQSGGVVAINRYDGSVRWASDVGIPRVTALATDPWTLAVAGVVGPELDLNHGKIVLLDLRTGAQLVDHVDLHTDFMPSIIGLNQDTLVAVAEGGEQVIEFDALTGQRLKEHPLADDGASPNGVMHRGVLAVEDLSGVVHVLDMMDGPRVTTRIRLGGGPTVAGVQMRTLGEGILMFGPKGAAALGHGGRELWRSEPLQGGGALHQALAGEGRVALVASMGPDGGDPDVLLAAGQSVTYRLDLIDRRGGLLESSYVLGPIEGQLDPRRAVITGGGVAFDMGPQTLLVPAADADSTGRADEAGRQ